MKGREVEHLEIHLIRFNVARGIDLEAHLRQDAQDAAQVGSGGMQASVAEGAARQGHIQLLLLEGFRQRLSFDLFQFRSERRLERLLDLVGHLARGGALLLGELPQPAESLHQRGTLTKVRDAPGFQRRLVGDRLQRFAECFFDFLQDVQHTTSVFVSLRTPNPREAGRVGEAISWRTKQEPIRARLLRRGQSSSQ